MRALTASPSVPRLPLLATSRIFRVSGLLFVVSTGTVVTALAEAVKAIKSGQSVEFRAEGEGEIRAPLGRVDFTKEQLLENCKCLVAEVSLGRRYICRQPFCRFSYAFLL